MGSGVMTRFCAEALLETDLRMIPDIFPPSPSGMFTRVLGRSTLGEGAPPMGEPTDANSAPCAFGCCLAVTAAAKDAVGAFFPESGASAAVRASPRRTSGLYAEC